jgi:hypothetical protein
MARKDPNMETAKFGRNGLWVARYARGITIFGVLVVIGGLAYGGGVALAYLTKPSGSVPPMGITDSVGVCVTGLLALAFANLLTYVLGGGQKPSWIARHADKGLYLLAGLRILNAGLLALYIPWPRALPFWFLGLMVSSLRTISDALILVALGLVVRRALPVIEESRTLI